MEMPERERKHYDFLKTKLWKEVRAKIMEYDNYRCLICGESVDAKTGHIHHVMDFSADEDLSPSNLVTLCIQCHNKLHPVFPKGMWLLGWPDLEKVKNELRGFYDKVKQASIKNKDRLKAPLEHLMMHLCLICQYNEKCDIGKYTLNDVSNRMEMFKAFTQKRCHIADLREGLKNVIVEGYITEKSEPKVVETKRGLRRFATALLKDETGEIILNLWEDQIEKVNVGDKIRIEEGYVVSYEGHLTLNVAEGKPFIINPTDTLSIPYWTPSEKSKGKKVSAKCSVCGKVFSYVYLGGPIKKRCSNCR